MNHSHNQVPRSFTLRDRATLAVALLVIAFATIVPNRAQAQGALQLDFGLPAPVRPASLLDRRLTPPTAAPTPPVVRTIQAPLNPGERTVEEFMFQTHALYQVARRRHELQRHARRKSRRRAIGILAGMLGAVLLSIPLAIVANDFSSSSSRRGDVLFLLFLRRLGG